ncbi:MAG: hypothetical protein C0467_09010 [Planctomycetaceae bacterium]|nr:hypothetical protein [Planctomycetaceae bacterium]
MLSELMEGDSERPAVLQELAGACLDPWLTVKFFAALVGEGDNEKTVFLTVLRALLGIANNSAVSLDAIAWDKFAMFGMFGYLLTSTLLKLERLKARREGESAPRRQSPM